MQLFLWGEKNTFPPVPTEPPKFDGGSYTPGDEGYLWGRPGRGHNAAIVDDDTAKKWFLMFPDVKGFSHWMGPLVGGIGVVYTLEIQRPEKRRPFREFCAKLGADNCILTINYRIAERRELNSEELPAWAKSGVWMRLMPFPECPNPNEAFYDSDVLILELADE